MFYTLQQIPLPCWPNFLWVDSFFVIRIKNTRTVFLECFVIILFESTDLSNRSWRIRRYFTPLLSVASFSTYARPKHQNWFMNLSNAFTLMSLREARVKFVYDRFDCEHCLTFDSGTLLAKKNAYKIISSTALRVQSLHLLKFIFWKASSFRSFWHFDSEPHLEIYQQCQLK